MDYELTVFIGRFQPFHQGHLSVVKRALECSDRLLILIGSAHAPRSHRNPFTFAERENMIRASVMEAGLDIGRVLFDHLEDACYNDESWMTQVRQAVNRVDAKSVALIGHSKDHTSFYLNMFPEFASINVPCHLNLSATPMREIYFSNAGHMWLNDCDGHKVGDPAQDHKVPTSVRAFLTGFMSSPEYKTIASEYEFVLKSRAPYMSLPYPPIFVTADACVIQSGHVLLVRRKNHPGIGQWAFPGGHVEATQTVLEAMLAELSQETTLNVDRDTIIGSIVHSNVYDDPYRDPRGRYITHAFLVHLKRNHSLPPIQANDDAADAAWIPLNEVKREMMFLDHYDILKHLTARI